MAGRRCECEEKSPPSPSWSWSTIFHIGLGVRSGRKLLDPRSQQLGGPLVDQGCGQRRHLPWPAATNALIQNRSLRTAGCNDVRIGNAISMMLRRGVEQVHLGSFDVENQLDPRLPPPAIV